MATKNVRVVATGPGYDNIQLRQKDDEFDMPESYFKDANGKVLAAEKQPSWFKLKEVGAAKPTAKPAGGEDLA